jgi:D-threo-aldose 1-dehydrogenase
MARLAFGAAEIGGLYEPLTDEQAEETVRRAVERGITSFDTAPHYGAGRSERRLGAVLSGLPRGSFTLSTKVGRVLVPLRPGEPPDDSGFPGEPAYTRAWDWTADGIRRSVSESLERLGLDRVDTAYLHDPDQHEDEVYATAYPALVRLRDEGVVGAIGVGMNQTAMLTRFVRRLDLDAVLCAGRYTLLDRSAADELLTACLERGTVVVAGGIYNSGLLAGGSTYDYRPATPEILARLARLRKTCAEYGVPLRAAALAFPARHPAVTSVLVGCRTAAEVDDNADMFAHDIPTALWDHL